MNTDRYNLKELDEQGLRHIATLIVLLILFSLCMLYVPNESESIMLNFWKSVTPYALWLFNLILCYYIWGYMTLIKDNRINWSSLHPHLYGWFVQYDPVYGDHYNYTMHGFMTCLIGMVITFILSMQVFPSFWLPFVVATIMTLMNVTAFWNHVKGRTS